MIYVWLLGLFRLQNRKVHIIFTVFMEEKCCELQRGGTRMTRSLQYKTVSFWYESKWVGGVRVKNRCRSDS